MIWSCGWLRVVRLLLAVAVLGALPHGAVGASVPGATADPPTLVKSLGSPHFALRERAMSQLIHQGVGALDAVERGVRSEDREIRFRCRRVLKIVQADEFQRRLHVFAAGGAAAQKVKLPSWDLFASQVDNSDVGRRLFVEMQKSEPELLRVLAQSPEQAYAALTRRVAEIQNRMRFNTSGTQVQIQLGSVAAILFVANNQTRSFPLQTSQYISSCLQLPNFRSALESGEQRGLLRGMLGTWIGNSEGWSAYQGMMMAMQHDIPEGLIAAKRILRDAANQPNQPYFRYYALSAIGKFGDTKEIPTIEPFLQDKTPYATAIPVNGKIKYRTQIRDVALAVLVHLAKQDPKNYGFDRIRKHSLYLFDPNSLAFANDDLREQAIKKWVEYRKHGLKGLPAFKPADARTAKPPDAAQG